MYKLFIALLSFFFVSGIITSSQAVGDPKILVDRELILLFNSFNKDIELHPLQTSEQLRIKLTFQEGYEVVRRELSKVKIPLVPPVDIVTVQGCWNKQNSGVCLRFRFAEKESIMQKFHELRNTATPIELLVIFEEITENRSKGNKFNVLNFKLIS